MVPEHENPSNESKLEGNKYEQPSKLINSNEAY